MKAVVNIYTVSLVLHVAYLEGHIAMIVKMC